MADAISELRHQIHKQGYDTELSNDGHYKVLDDKGEQVRTKKGKPIRFAATPATGSSRALSNIVSQLRSAGVLPPATAPKRNGSRKVKLNTERLKQYSDVLRPELVSLMKQHELRQVDVSKYADYYAAQHGIAVPSWGQGVVSSFLKGKALSNSSYAWLSAAVSALKATGGVIPQPVASRHAPGMQGPLETADPGEPTGVQVEGESKVHAHRVPTLALDVMRWVYDDNKDHDAIRALVEQIARLELK